MSGFCFMLFLFLVSCEMLVYIKMAINFTCVMNIIPINHVLRKQHG